MSASVAGPGFRARVRGAAEPVAAVFGRLGLTPNHLTVAGFLIAIVAAAVAATQAWLAAGLLVLFGAGFDLFDGALARATGTSSRFGAFLDSTLDRWGEGIVYLGILWGTIDLGLWRPILLTGAASVSAFMVSYTRAKSESLGFTPGNRMASVGLAPREVRVVILVVGLVAAGLLSGQQPTGGAGGAAYPLSGLALEAAMGLIAILATVTTIQRILHVARAGGPSDRRPEPRQAKEG